MNMARRFLHLQRENSKMPNKTTEFGEEVPVIGGRYYPIPKACISLKGLTVATVQANHIVWEADEVLCRAFARDLKSFTAADFKKAWIAFLD